MAEVGNLQVHLGLDSADFTKNISSINRKMKVVESDFKLAKSSVDGFGESVDDLKTIEESLTKQMDLQGQKVDELRRQYEHFAETKGKDAKETENALIKLNKAHAYYNKLDNQLGETTSKIKEQTSAWSKLQSKMNEAADGLRNVGERMSGIGDTLSMSLTAPLAGVFALATEGTREFRTELAKLENNTKVAGGNVEELEGNLRKVESVTGEMDSAVEGLSNLLETSFKGDKFQAVLDQLIGASLKFKDTLKFEGIADGLQETMAVGEAAGPFAELLERLGNNLDTFNAGLKEAKANGTEQDYVLSTLAKHGLTDVYEMYKKNNEELINSANAQFDFQKALSGLGSALEPIMTRFTKLLTDLVNKFNELTPAGQKIVLIVGAIAAAIGPVLVVLGSLVTFIGGLTSAFASLGGVGAALGAVFTALIGPIGITIAAISGAIAIGVALYKNWEEVKGFLTKTWETISDTAKRIWGGIETFFEKLNFMEIGENLIQGLISGIKSKLKDAKDAALKVASSVKDAITNFFDIRSPSKLMEEMGSYISQGLAKGIESGEAEEAARKESERIRKQFELAQQWINRQKELDNLSPIEEVKLWEEVSRSYADGTEERAKADVELYNSKKRIYDSLKQINEDYLKSVDEINKRVANSEERLNQEYQDKLDRRTDSIANFMGMFDEFEIKDISGGQLLKNLRGQVEAMESWTTDLQELSGRGLSQNLIQELREMGPAAANEIKAMTKLSDERLQEYSELFTRKGNLAKSAANTELIPEKEAMGEEMKLIYAEAKKELEGKATQLTNRISEILNGPKEQFNLLTASLTDIGTKAVEGLINGLDGMKGKLSKKAAELSEIMGSAIGSEIGLTPLPSIQPPPVTGGRSQTVNQTPAQPQSQPVSITIQTMNVRNEEDIEKLAEKLQRLIDRKKRVGG